MTVPEGAYRTVMCQFGMAQCQVSTVAGQMDLAPYSALSVWNGTVVVKYSIVVDKNSIVAIWHGPVLVWCTVP